MPSSCAFWVGSRDISRTALAAWLLLTPVLAQGRKISGTLPTGDHAREFAVSPDGAWVVFETDHPGGNSLYAVPSLGQRAPVRLDQASDGNPGTFAIDPGGRRVVFLSHLYSVAGSTSNLFSVPLDGSASPARLNAPLATSSRHVREFALSADGTTVVYRAQQDSSSFELYAVPIDASLPPRKLSTPMLALRQVSAGPFLTADGARVLYLADADTFTVDELYSVPLDGSQAPVKLNRPLTSGNVLDSLAFSPDGLRVVFNVTFRDLYSAPTDGSHAAVRLTPSPAFHSAGRVAITADSAHVVFSADLGVSSRYDLYSVPIDGGSPPAELTPAGMTGSDFALTADSTRVVFIDNSTNPEGLYVAPLDRSVPPVRLNDPLQGRRFRAFALAHEHVVYVADQEADELYELFSAPLDGSHAPRRLNEPFVGPLRDVFDFELAPDGRSVLYRANQELAVRLELFLAPLDGGAAPVRVNGALTTNGNVGMVVQGSGGSPLVVGDFYDFGRLGQVFYVADQDEDDLYELYTSFATRPVRAAR